ncbi:MULTISPECIES: helix-turn-helix transcriptional regulator [Herbaspirillum]|uniref:helix-turn-helix transcriptional regulator n=2 Tax=Bacteria TaxID=2 RepID=UPI000C0A2A3B|nr:MULTISPECIES: AraC family transcriptional regulator [Herbaspirillum]MAF01346.1 AraC family transcriptional regulator [Herbaspirillum sp.]MBO18801.1 AraC family transcriptional regulator [Herbaspirillum sp.]MEE1635362.1 AraC family transcriptional regulator [Herbaspirillum huttiense NC40101]|tara:strand:- start:894 stop:1871 length:978 start_codon:yes stop_codon:yes gene_type:complete
MDQHNEDWSVAEDGSVRMEHHPLLPSVVLPAEWAAMMRVDELAGGISITGWHGHPRQALDVRATGPALFCVALLLEGRAAMALDGGPLLELEAGMAVIQTADRPVTGRFCVKGGAAIRLVDIRFTLQALADVGGRPLSSLQRDLLRDCSLPEAGALMGGLHAPPVMLRIASEILQCDFSGDLRCLYLRAKALETLAQLLQHLHCGSRGEVGTREQRQLEQARRLLEQRYAESWSIDRLAQAVGLNQKKLQAGFRVMAGRTVHAHLRELRLHAAATMLAEGVGVADTALAVGFSNLSHFSKSFRQTYGVTPSQWRQHLPPHARLLP